MPGPLVLVPGHGVCVRPAAPEREASWIGIHAGEAELLLQHARAGVAEAARCAGVLVFSGGQTQLLAGALSEGQSYFDLSSQADWWGSPEVGAAALVEGFARDSLENLRCALSCYRQHLACLPSSIVVCGWGFKSARFAMHAAALGCSQGFRYLAINDPEPGAALDAARRGEAEKCAALLSDPLLEDQRWQLQRSQRDPFQRGAP